MPKLNLAVIFGGRSGEHEVSLRSAKQVMAALDREKYNVIPIAITKKGNWLVGAKGEEYMRLNEPLAANEGGVSVDDSQSLVHASPDANSLTAFAQGDFSGKIDLVLPIGHGPFIEDGRLQGMLDMLGIPYVFSGVLPSALAMNKHKTKLIAKSAGLKTAKEVLLAKNKKFDHNKLIAKLGLPIVVKPVELGSSVGIMIADSEDNLKTAIGKAFEHGDEVMLEQFVKGRELTVAVMGRQKPKALPVVEIIPKVSGWFDYKAKYQAGGSEEVCPAHIPDETRKKVQRYAVKIFQALGCRDLARADFILGEADGKLCFLEINTIPGMTATSLAPQAAKAAGMEFPKLLDELIAGAKY
jgi:D-alanine-D-alanine ligase